MTGVLSRRRQLAGLVLRQRQVSLTVLRQEYYTKQDAVESSREQLGIASALADRSLKQAVNALGEGATLDMHIMASTRVVVAMHELNREQCADCVATAEGEEGLALRALKDGANEVRAVTQLEAGLKNTILRYNEKFEDRLIMEAWLLKGSSYEQ